MPVGAGVGGSPCPTPHTQGSFVLSPVFACQIIQDGGSTIDRDSATISAQTIEGLFTVYKSRGELAVTKILFNSQRNSSRLKFSESISLNAPKLSFLLRPGFILLIFK